MHCGPVSHVPFKYGLNWWSVSVTIVLLNNVAISVDNSIKAHISRYLFIHQCIQIDIYYYYIISVCCQSVLLQCTVLTSTLHSASLDTSKIWSSKVSKYENIISRGVSTISTEVSTISRELSTISTCRSYEPTPAPKEELKLQYDAKTQKYVPVRQTPAYQPTTPRWTQFHCSCLQYFLIFHQIFHFEVD